MATQKIRTPPKRRSEAAAALRGRQEPIVSPAEDRREPISAPHPASQPTASESSLPQEARILRSTSGTEIEAESLLFDTDWYRAQYSDVALAGLDPIRHYFDNGAREGRDPNALFSTNWYISAYADVASSKMNPFLHYLLYGAREGRKPRA